MLELNIEMRKLLLNLHLYAALAVGVFVVILGATGSVMAFEDQLDHLFHPHLFYVTPKARSLPLIDLANAAAARFPGETAAGFGMSVSSDLSYYVDFPSGIVFVNQYTGDVLGVRDGPTFLSNVHQIHLRLLAGNIGKTIVSWVGVVMLFLLVSGFYLWWPLKRIGIKWGGTSKRVWFDIHNTAGIFSLVFLLLLTLTGIVIGFESVSTPLFYRITRSEPVRGNIRAAARSVPRISPDQAVDAARAALPGATPISVNVPGPTGVYRVALRFSEDLTPGGRSRVFLDPYNGQVLQVESSRTTAAGTRMVNANRAIHTGDIFGIPSKALMSLASLMAALQVVSGVTMWWKRRQAR
jgi:uncharacterized iron-regulated membrane protein